MLSISLWQLMMLVGLGALVAVICILVGGFVAYRCFTAVQGSGFLGGVPKGQVYTIPEVDNAQDYPDTEANILKKTADFLKVFGGDKQ